MKKSPTPNECRDTGLALAFLALLVWLASHRPVWVYLAMAVILITMILPAAMSYPARLWFGLSHAMGTIMNKVILTLLFCLVVLPVALIRKALGKDAMGFRLWRDGKPSAFVVREHVFAKDDLENTY